MRLKKLNIRNLHQKTHSYTNEKKDLFINFNNLLTEEQKKIYHGIVHERLMIYIMGMILGISLGIVLGAYLKNNIEMVSH